MTGPYQQPCHVALQLRARTPQEIRQKDPILWNIQQNNSTVRFDSKFLSRIHEDDCDDQLFNNNNASAYYKNSSKAQFAKQFKFKFNECYSYESKNQEIYNRSIKRLVQSSMKGVTGMAIFYGSTNSGKTETVIGSAKKNQPFFGDLNNQQTLFFKLDKNDITSPNGSNIGSLYNNYGILGKTASELCQSQSILDLLNQQQLNPLQYQQENQIPRSISSQRFYKQRPNHQLLSKVNTSIHSKCPSQKNERQQTLILASKCGGKQELIYDQESAYYLIKRSQEVKQKLFSSGTITQSLSHTIYQFSITSLHRGNSHNKGVNGNSPSFGKRQHQYIQSIEYTQQQRPTILTNQGSNSTQSSNQQSINRNFSPNSQLHPFHGSLQSKPPSFSGGESVMHNFLNDNSNAFQNFNIAVSSLSLVESAGCENLLQRQNLMSSKSTKSLEALRNCIMNNEIKFNKIQSSAVINPIIRQINKINSQILCSIVISISPVMGQIKNSLHSINLGKKALGLIFKPLRNIIASQSAMTSLLESYQHALSAKSKQQARTSNRVSVYNSSGSVSASSSSRTYQNKKPIMTTAGNSSLIIKST